MVRHIVLWRHKDGLTQEEMSANASDIKRLLEGLKGVIDGIISLTVVTEPLPGSNMEIMLYSEFADEHALAAYQTHPEHVRASEHIGTLATGRTCFDQLI